ncbi:MAG: M48 family metallopeptidase [Anaerolineae bacterium]
MELREEAEHTTRKLDAEVELDPQRQAKAETYARTRRMWMLVELVVSLGLLLVFWLSGLSQALRDLWIDLGVSNPWALTAVYVLTLEIAGTLLFLPLGYWTGYVLPHRYDLSTQTLAGWLKDQAKILGLEILLGIPAIEVIYWLLRTQPNTWWMWGAGFMILLNTILGALAPVLLVPIFYKLEPLEDEALVDRIKDLAQRTGTKVAEVKTIDLSSRTTAANAMVMGLGSTKRIALGDTLYEDFSSDEIESVLAHELGHQIHHDLELGIAVQTVLTIAGFYLVHVILRWSVHRFGFDSIADLAALPFVAMVGMLGSLAIGPLINAYSRWRERMADRFALDVIESPTAFANAMIRLSNQNLAEADPPEWVVWLLYDHPPIKERIEMARRYSTARHQA